MIQTTVPTTAEVDMSPDDHRPEPARRRSRGAELGTLTTYLLAAFPISLIFFIVVITLLSVGVSTLIIWVGIPVLTAGLLVARAAATLERTQLRNLVGIDAPAPVYRKASGGLMGRLTSSWRDPQSWFDALWVFVDFIIATIVFCFALTWWVGAIGMVAAPLAQLILEVVLPPEDTSGLGELLGLGGIWFDVALSFVAGLIFALTLLPMLRLLATVRSSISRALLSGRAADQQRMQHLEGSRDAVRRAETDSLRRLERDIHDGPQQRLIRLNMDLARARRMAATDPENAQIILADAMGQTQDTLAELRQLSRGIAPPILVDRGLAAAVQEAATRSAFPVEVEVAVPADLPDHLQTVAYFVISEALTNANKHADATSAEVTAAVIEDELFITIVDNGRGGADLGKGHGLAGLADRVHGVDGELHVESPLGGPTMVQAVVPCRS